MSTYASQTTTPLTIAEFIELPKLLERAAASKDLLIKEYRKDRQYSETKPIGTYKLGTGLLEALGKVGFTFESGKKSPHNTMIYLSGNSNQRGQEIFESDCWAWERTEKNHKLTIRFRLSISEKDRGVIAVPYIWGNCSGGACHRPTINKLAVAIAEYFPDAHSLLKEMTTDSYPVIHWGDIGLGGIKSVSELFRELYGHNKSILKLADSNISPFAPIPFGWAGNNYFVIEFDQPRLFEQWKKQLQEYKNRLG